MGIMAAVLVLPSHRQHSIPDIDTAVFYSKSSARELLVKGKIINPALKVEPCKAAPEDEFITLVSGFICVFQNDDFSGLSKLTKGTVPETHRAVFFNPENISFRRILFPKGSEFHVQFFGEYQPGYLIALILIDSERQFPLFIERHAGRLFLRNGTEMLLTDDEKFINMAVMTRRVRLERGN
jgi:hypothetical protein